MKESNAILLTLMCEDGVANCCTECILMRSEVARGAQDRNSRQMSHSHLEVTQIQSQCFTDRRQPSAQRLLPYPVPYFEMLLQAGKASSEYML